MTTRSSITFVGDYMPVKNFPFSPAGTRESHLVANLETAIGASPVGGKAYPICMSDSAYDVIRDSQFTALNLANNHVFDAGKNAFEHMVGVLMGLADGPQLYGLRDKPAAEVEIDGRSCAIIGCLESCRTRSDLIFRQEDVERLIRNLRGSYDRVFVTPHWGKEGEYASYPSPAQRRVAARWVNAGADAIMGHHSHTIQGMERLTGKNVYYSLGNSLFVHEECARYALTRYGLSITWSPADDADGDSYDVEFLRTDDGTRIDEPSQIALLQTRLRCISEEFSSNAGLASWWEWARKVGPVYIPKSRISWQRRFASHPMRTLPRWLGWSIMPATVLLTLGSMFPASTSLSQGDPLAK